MNTEQKFEKALQTLIAQSGADLHIREDRFVYVRIKRQIIPLTDLDPFKREECVELLRNLLTKEKLDTLSQNKSVDFSAVILNRRLRGNAFVERGKMGIVFRLIPFIQTLNELNLPTVLQAIAMREQGFFLVTGSVGNGKSTTLASMVKMIIENKPKHLITVEDPIEFFYDDSKSFVDQREVGIDVNNFEDALKNALRQDADVLVVGEMRNKETMQMAITAAQTGHLVFSTLHTNTATQSIERIVDVFPAESQREIRVALSVSLLGIFCQKLIPTVNGGIVPAYELMLNTSSVSHLIREGRIKDLDIQIENGARDGHVSYNRSLLNLYEQGIISKETALTYTNDREGLEFLLK
jgi:twitching motility protein PilT